MYKNRPARLGTLGRTNTNRVRAYTPKPSAVVSHKRNSFRLEHNVSEMGRIAAKNTYKKEA